MSSSEREATCNLYIHRCASAFSAVNSRLEYFVDSEYADVISNTEQQLSHCIYQDRQIGHVTVIPVSLELALKSTAELVAALNVLDHTVYSQLLQLVQFKFHIESDSTSQCFISNICTCCSAFIVSKNFCFSAQ